MEYRGYKISINKGCKYKVRVENERGANYFSRLLEAKQHITEWQFGHPKFMLEICEDVLKAEFTYVWRGNFDVIAAAALNNGMFANLWADLKAKKAEITFINIAPVDTEEPMDKLIREIRCDFYMYYHVWEVKKIENRLIIQFR